MNNIVYRQLRRSRRLFHRVHSAYQRAAQALASRWQLSKTPEFNKLLREIASGEGIDRTEVLRYISQENLAERLWTNLKLAEACYRTREYDQAKVFIRRVWLFSGLDEQYLPLFIAIHAADNDVGPIREAHKALGIKKSQAGKTSEALKHFNDWQYAYAVHLKADDYRYDYEILDWISSLAKPHAFPARKSTPGFPNRKLRLAHLMFGMTHTNSVIVEISLLFAKYHDPSLFEVTFYVPEQASLIFSHQEAVNNINTIKSFGWNVVIAPNAISEEQSLVDLSRTIYESEADILVTSAGLADLKHYFITSLRPAPIVVGLCQGPAPQYIAPDFTWSITWFRSLVLDCPVDCSFVNLRLDLPERKYSREEAKSIFGIPKERLVFMTCGRPAKLQDLGFLKTLIDTVSSHPDAYLVVVGLGDLPTILREQLTPSIRERIKVFGWVTDFTKVLSMADIVVDTYPSGGGVLIKDAAALGTPVVSFKHDYMKTFSQKECSAAEEVIGIPELLIERGDFVALNSILCRLLADHNYREYLSVLCKQRINETSGHSERMIKDCEEIYLEVARKYALGTGLP